MLRNIVDKVVAVGYYVIVPDFFHGDPYNPENASRSTPIWLKDHGRDKGSEATESIIEALKSKDIPLARKHSFGMTFVSSFGYLETKVRPFDLHYIRALGLVLAISFIHRRSIAALVARRREYLYLGGLLSFGLSILQLHSSSLRFVVAFREEFYKLYLPTLGDIKEMVRFKLGLPILSII
ncbi:hypothetical protein JHK87_027668 [Glycine soja]|nr:hypothetical protein JHK87_027668 [Glycine soja]